MSVAQDVILPHDVRYDLTLTPWDKLVYAEFRAFCPYNDGVGSEAVLHISKVYDRAINSVWTSMGKLVNKGYIIKQKNIDKVEVYSLIELALVPQVEAPITRKSNVTLSDEEKQEKLKAKKKKFADRMAQANERLKYPMPKAAMIEFYLYWTELTSEGGMEMRYQKEEAFEEVIYMAEAQFQSELLSDWSASTSERNRLQ